MGKFGSFFKGNSYGRDNISESGENLILYGDLFTLYSGRIEKVINHTESVFDNAVYGEPGDLLFPGSTTVDALSLISPSALMKKSLLGGDVIAYRSKKLSATFLAFLILGRYRQDFAKKAQGTTIVHMYASSLSEIPIMVPIDKQEQEKIGSFLSAIDRLIEKQKGKVDRIKSLKKGYLQKMFPADGEDFPQNRFKEFKDSWKQCELVKIADVRDGTHDSPSYVNEGYPFITSKNVKDGYINYDDVQFISKTDFDHFNKRSKVEINDILMGMIGTIGNLALIREEPNFAIKNVALIKDVKKVNHKFLYHYLQSINILKQLLEGLDGGTQKFVSLSKVRSLKIKISSQNEQRLIGDFLEKLDKLITLHQRMLSNHEQLKQGFLQKIFAD